MSVRGLALHAQRIGMLFASPATWGRLIRERGLAAAARSCLSSSAGGTSSISPPHPPYLVDYDGTNHPQSFEREQAGKDNNKKWDSYVDPKTSVEFFASFLRVALAHALTPNPAIYQWHASRRQALVE